MTRKPAAKSGKAKKSAAQKTPAKGRTAIPLCAGIDTFPPFATNMSDEESLDDLLAQCGREHSLVKMAANGKVASLLKSISGHSPYLWQLCIRDPDRLARLLEVSPDKAMSVCLGRLKKDLSTCVDEQAAMHSLRRMKQEAHLLIALADLGGIWDVDRVVAGISDMADAAVAGALDFILRQTHDAGKIQLPDRDNPGTGSGVIVLALGKHGARELNYSSDIDLIVFYDPKCACLDDSSMAPQLFVRVTRQLVKLLQELTEDGYVLRVDLRLRPDPGSTAVAISLPAAFSYYESVGQNWERAAFIKARPIAGDIALGEQFIADLAPFIWRKYFDYAAIADVHAMKRQIHAVRGHGRIAVAGHDIKLGRGGIREVEFFVQTQQLIFGGRRPHLRGSRTLEMLGALEADGWITREAVGQLSHAYRFLRTIEHRLQMRIDEQTQRLPSEEAELDEFARFCGYETRYDFEHAIVAEMENVERHYARLFENAPALSSAIGSLVFAGSSDDPETVETLRQLGFTEAERAIETVRGWFFGRRAAIQSARSREVLTELVPSLIEAFSGSGDPDAALSAFDEALGHMPASVELLSILKSNTPVRELFGDILGGAPHLAHVVTQRPHVLDAAIDPSLLGHVRDEAYYKERAARIATNQDVTESVLDAMRELALEESFLVGIRMFSGTIDAPSAGLQFSALATSLIGVALDHILYLFERDHGTIEGGQCVILGLGKLGSGEMTATSDLDLILLYDFDEENPYSNGRRSLHANQYYARVTQRLVSALTVPTRRGPLYEVDMRLRPSGRQGPVATSLRSFRDYQLSEAETWEHMALSRARVVSGASDLGSRAQAVIHEVLTMERDDTLLRKSIVDMRAMIADAKGDDDPWDLKIMSGGLVDIEFCAQYLTLRYASQEPEICNVSTETVLKAAGKVRVIDPAIASHLLEAHLFYSAIMQTLRLAVEGPFDPDKTPSGVLRRIADAVNLPDFRTVERELQSYRRSVRTAFLTLLEPEGEG
jgi:glutamate-ammonia-ligase adenylyltransferase